MNLHISEQGERIIRSQLQTGRFSSEDEVIDEALRRLDSKPEPLADVNPAVAAHQLLQQRLLAAGLISEVKPPITDTSPWQGRKAVPIEGEPLSEMIIRERR